MGKVPFIFLKRRIIHRSGQKIPKKAIQLYGNHHLNTQNTILSYSDTLRLYICIERFYADDIPYSTWYSGAFRGRRRRERVRHHLAVESVAFPDFSGNRGVAYVLWRVKKAFPVFFLQKCY